MPPRWKQTVEPIAVRLLIGASRARFLLRRPAPSRLNLCAGTQRIPGWFSIDIGGDVDLRLDLGRSDLPFPDASVDAVACMSAINYFTRDRAQALVRETRRVLKPGGVARFGVQDLRKLAALYLARDLAFFEQKKADGTQRFEGETLGDKFVAWFYGYRTAGGPGRYVYDFDSLSLLFRRAGFSLVEERPYRSSRLAEVESLDNRPEQMFFLEAIK